MANRILRYIAKYRPCPDQTNCGSSDAYSVVEDTEGVHGFCYSCQKRFEVDDEYESTTIQHERVSEKLSFFSVEEISTDYRHISKKTLDECGIKKVEGRNAIVYPYFSYDKSETAQKVRLGKTPEGKKKFTWRGPTDKMGLFGQHLFPRGGKRVTITTGENDALAIIDMMGWFPTVSLKDGDGSVKRLSEGDHEYLNSFDEIVVCFDQDSSGRESMEKLVNIFPAKTKVVELPKGYKDAHEMLEAGDTKAFKNAWWNAKEWRPNNIVFPSDIKDDVLNPPKYDIIPYPWESLNAQIFGLHTPEVITVLAEPKVGKCAHRLSRVLTPQGKVVEAGSLKLGDRLCGPDGSPRTIVKLKTVKRPAFKVTLDSEYEFICSDTHDLWVSHYRNKTPHRIEAGLLGKLPNEFLNDLRLEFSEGVSWEKETKPEIDPYLVGLWLGDGSSSQPEITTMDKEVVIYLEKFCKENGERLYKKKKTQKNRADTYRINNDVSKKSCSKFWEFAKTHNLKNNKHVPDIIKFSSKENRLKLLAGYIDADGYKRSGTSFSYEACSVSETLANDIAFVARSLGFKVNISLRKKKCHNNDAIETYYYLYIQGECSNIPVLIERKKFSGKRTKEWKYCQFKVEDLGYEEEFVSFELDGDHLYLHENFLVDHNSFFTAMIAHHLWKTTKEKVGDISVENTPDERARTLLSMHMGKPLHLTLAGEDIGVPKPEIEKAFDEYFEDRRIALFEKDGLTDPMELMGKIDYFIEVLGCRFIIFDHINYLTSYHSDDERKTLDKLSNMLVDKAKDKRINMMIVSHVNDEGKTFGSRNLIKASHTVIRLSRDRDNPNEDIRNMTELKVTESRRYGSRIGPPIYLRYREDNFSWTEVDPEIVEDLKKNEELEDL